RLVVCGGDGRAPLVEYHEMRAPKGFEISFRVAHVGRPPIVPVGGRCVPPPARDFCGWRRVTGGPLKPSFGLSGAVRPPDTIFRLPVRAFSPSIRTQSPPFRRTRLRTDESCSTPNLPHAHTIRASPGCDGYNEAFPRTGHDSGC